LVICAGGVSQTKTFSSLSKYEKRWAIFHPFASYKIKKHQAEMYSVYNEVKKNNTLDQFANGGKLDAFRHTFAMAFFSRYVSTRKLRKLGKAHEKGNFANFRKGILEEGELADSLSSVMDLANNELGFTIGKAYCNKTVAELKEGVIKAINSGGALIMNRSNSGHYLSCDNQILMVEDLQGKWQNKKCLVPSNH
jgi:hypothetical protein